MKKRCKKCMVVLLALLIISGVFGGIDARAEGTAVQVDSQEKLVEAINSADTSAVIELTEDITLTSKVSVPEGKEITLIGGYSLIRDLSFTGTGAEDVPMLDVAQGARLIIDGITVDGNHVDLSRLYAQHAIASLVRCRGTLVVNSGTLKNGYFTGLNSGAVLVDGPSARFDMYKGTISDNEGHAIAHMGDRIGTVLIICGAQFHMYGGSIEKNTCAAWYNANCTAGIMALSDVSGTPKDSTTLFHMHDGRIADNKVIPDAPDTSGVAAGGGVCLMGQDWDYWNRYARMIMDGGTIEGNQTSYGGGGVFCLGLASFEMNDGKIINNTVTDGMGGGVCAYDSLKDFGLDDQTIQFYSTNYHMAEFTMKKGTISGNQALRGNGSGDGGCGGGIYIATMNARIESGDIINNTAVRQGGGIYVGSTPYVLQMYNTLITDNTASVLGGGLWFCPTGDATNTVTNGGAIFGNHTTGSDTAAGDDFAAVPNTNSHTVNLADRMLGGGEVKWYIDGGVDGSNILGTSNGSPRYDEKKPGDRQTGIKNYSQGIALKAVVSEQASELARSMTKIRVTGNTSERGGGIGSNGTVLIGTPDEWTLEVTKSWEGIPEESQKPVTIRLKIGSYELDQVTLNQENGWTAYFTQLPNPDTLGEVSVGVVEDETEYDVQYSETERDDTEKKLKITVTNSRKVQYGGLTVSKTVSGTGISKKQEFAFTVTLTDKNINGTYGDMTFVNGVASFALKADESKKAENLPENIGYRVEESNCKEYQVTIKVNDAECALAEGIIVAGENASVAFHNHKDDTTETSPDPGKPNKPGNHSETPETGDHTQAGFWLVLMVSALAGIGLVVLKGKLKGRIPERTKKKY